MSTCDLCSSRFQMGLSKYQGKYVPSYGIQVCKPCYDSNWDGWSPNHEIKIVKIANAKNIKLPQRNDEGLLPRD